MRNEPFRAFPIAVRSAETTTTSSGFFLPTAARSSAEPEHVLTTGALTRRAPEIWARKFSTLREDDMILWIKLFCRRCTSSLGIGNPVFCCEGVSHVVVLRMSVVGIVEFPDDGSDAFVDVT